MSMAYLVAMSSKDTRTKIGAVIVGPDNEVRSTGYNGMPRGCFDEVGERYIAPEKYHWFEHAERNAIYNAARMGTPIQGCILYTQAMPCSACARAVVQAGIHEIVIHKDFDMDHWKENHRRARIMLAECGVNVVEWEGSLVRSEKYLCGTQSSLD